MQRLNSVDPASATGKTKELLDIVQRRHGRIPNMVRLMANSSAALDGYLKLAVALAGSTLPAEVRDSIAVLVAADGGSDYTLAIVSAVARRDGLNDDDIAAAQRAQAKNPKIVAALRFSEILLEQRGHVSSSNLDALMEAGFTDGEVAEIIATIVLNIYRNYFNLVARPEMDFPVVNRVAAAG
ncbi:MAG TPA: carboxymuconolactone decarboxylase family protein [Bradyrhizobium sp.]|nr:carboxymuconolactone decarboxylase family protein [Bradyrhizobium sp.]